MTILLRRFNEDVALIAHARAALMAGIALRELEPQAAMHPYYKEIGKSLKPKLELSDDGMGKKIAKLPIEGTLAYAPHPMEMVAYDMEDLRNISDMIDEAENDPQISGVLMAVDSPGGFYTGAVDVADSIARLNEKKPVVAHVGGMSASLAYMLTSQAGEIVAGKGSSVGSLGAYIMTVDASRFYQSRGIEFQKFTNKEGDLKGFGGPQLPLTVEQQKYLGERAQSTFNEFMGVIESKRSGIQADTKRGQTFQGQDAQARGLVDRIGGEAFAKGVLRGKIEAKNKADAEAFLKGAAA